MKHPLTIPDAWQPLTRKQAARYHHAAFSGWQTDVAGIPIIMLLFWRNDRWFWVIAIIDREHSIHAEWLMEASTPDQPAAPFHLADAYLGRVR